MRELIAPLLSRGLIVPDNFCSISFPRGIVAWIFNRHCEERSDAAIQKK
ncbi:hypothetical protein [Rickettsia felis]|nr:hypothetical protein [Rickettsia felis]